MTTTNEKFTFWISYYYALKNLGSENFKVVMLALFEYAFFNKRTELSGRNLDTFLSLKPYIDSGRIKVFAGQKGGRKRTARKLYDLKNGEVVLSETGKKYETLLKKVNKYCTENSINIDCEKLAIKYCNKKINDLPKLIEEWKSQDDQYEKRKNEQ
ncbi:hypothetical protein NO1_0251 [Candidatus Termititenax aidoneus]|uniref:Uncharacterized protein n=1 Tax=Termititenax aidoneus TaxID=2218524 RepID=A0A388T9A3_TERA1|nr:hypothetical protein NO1_0251 [Candidatus Termititenax aidoneus]